MKKLLTSVVLLLCSIVTSFAQYSGSGTGTESDPYLIFNENQLSQVSNFLNQSGVVFKLMKDLDLTNWIAENNPSQGWLPIGVKSSPFKGKFYGNYKTISGLSINRTSTDNMGFFGYAEGATITNLTLKGSSVKGKNNVGCLAGQLKTCTVTSCKVELTDKVSGTGYVGGLVGYSNGSTYSSITVNSSCSASSGGYLGGCIGYVSGGKLTTATIVGDVSSTAGYVGGVCGYANGFTISGVKKSGDISGESQTGGIFGWCSNGYLTNCSYTGNISGTTNVGGIVGKLETTTTSLTSCRSKGKITATGDYCGGVIGGSYGACISSMQSCSHFGDINGKSYVGGLIGAVLNVDNPPTLSTYKVYSGRIDSSPNYTPSGTLLYTLTEPITNGTSTTSPINNCTAIGNLTGSRCIGGLIGSDIPSYKYTSVNKSEIYSNSSYTKYLFKDGKYVTYEGKSYDLEIKYNSYPRNISALSLTNNYYSGNINGDENVGGLVGEKGGGTISKNYSYANIYGSKNVGGIVGKVSAEKVSDSYNTTTVKSNVATNSTLSASVSHLGRIYGAVEANAVSIGALGSAEGNRALAQTKVVRSGIVQEVGDDLQQGSSIGPSLLRLKATYVSMGWSFDNDWDILETECYPYKKYQAAPPVIESDLVSQATTISGKSTNGGTVYLYYKDREPVSTTCDGYNWTFTTEALQSGAQVQIYADVEDMTPSYFTTTTVGYPGSGTEEDPYRIYTAEDLQGASNRGYYKLMNDIDLTAWINENSPTTGWPAIGRNSGEATYIDGDGHKVTGLWINTTEDYNGLFSNFSAGQIKNLTVEVATGKKIKGGNYTGILIGRNTNGRIANCTVKGTVEGTSNVGGVAGYTGNTTISAITADAVVTGTMYVGGIAGQSSSCTITNCNAVSTIKCSISNAYVGGLIGYSSKGTITKCKARTTLSATGATNYAGGLVGYSTTPITLSFSTGNVKASGSDSYAGGLVGYAKSEISNCYSTATTSGTLYTAALVGYTFSKVDKCYAKGDIYGSMYGGGVVGELDGSDASLTNSVACSNILSLTAQSSWGSRVIGGYKNDAADPDSSNYALSTMQVSMNNVPQTKTEDIVEGIAKSEADLLKAETYMALGWDFTTVWGIDEGSMYPYLLWEVDVNPVADISFDKTTLVLAVGKSETINANVLPLGATNKRLEWTSSSDAVATVEDGVVTAVGIGTATITATSTDGSNISATCKVTVVENKDAAIEQLQAIVDRAQSLYANSVEGDNIGEYAAGARAELLAVINSVKANISSTMTDEEITQCTNDINAAIELFQSKQVTAGADTDYSTIDNTIYLERVESSAGGQLTLSVKMKNTVNVQGYQFDLYLPDGVTVAKDADGIEMAELSTSRTTLKKTDYFNVKEQQDGSLRVLCGSSKGYTFEGTDGEVALITLSIGSEIAEGEHPIILKNVVLTDKNSVPYETEYLKSTLVISSYTLGDVNADGSINVADFMAVANHILGDTPEGFVEKAADINEDNTINVADFMGVANLILNGGNTAKVFDVLMAKAKAPLRAATNIDNLENAIYVEPVSAAAGTQQELSIKMKNSGEVAAFEFSLQLPEGITFATDDDDILMAELSTERTTARKTDYFGSAIQADGTMKVLCGTSTENPNTGKPWTFSGNEGEVARITVNIPSDYTKGVYEVKILDAIITDASSNPTPLESVITTELTITDNSVVLDETSTTVPENATGVNVTVKRTLNADEWTTICLPFAMSETQLKAAFGEDVKVSDFTGCVPTEDASGNVTALRINSTSVTTMEANHPYLICVGNDMTEFSMENVDIVVEEELSIDCDRIGSGTKRDPYRYNSLVGTYIAETQVPEEAMYMNAGKYIYSNGTAKLLGYCGYFDFYDVLDDMTTAGNTVLLYVDNMPTAIGHITTDGFLPTGKVYTIDGRYVGKDVPTNRLTKGIYLLNGKKIVIK